MENAKYFDIHDKDVTPEIYTLLFCDAFVELKGNDIYYRISPLGNPDWEDEDGWKNYPATEYMLSSEEQFKKKVRTRI